MTVERTLFSEVFLATAEKNGFRGRITDTHIASFHTLTEHMLTVNEQFNLTAIREWKRVILLHYMDCLLASALYPEGACVIDVGCGAGFPSLPLAIFRPDLSILALDSTAKRVGYVAETAKLLGLKNFTALVGRAEDVACVSAHRERYDVATARAVAPLPILAELCLPYVKVGGAFIALKGKSAAEELASASHAIAVLGGGKGALADTPILSPEGESFSHASIIIPKSKATPSVYPRLYTKIVKKPL